MGKTGLIHHVLNKLPKNYIGIYVDILFSSCLNDFLNSLATAVFNASNKSPKIGKRIFDFIKSLRPSIGFDPLNGNPQVSFEIKQKEVEDRIEQIIYFLEQMQNFTVIAIDEFQQITKYPEKNMDAWFRTIIQRLNNCVFIFSGSHQQLMNELFNSPKKPFYRSTQLLKLSNIPRQEYKSFIVNKFHEINKQIDAKTVDKILDWTNIHTYYVQLLCKRISMIKNKIIDDELWQDEAYKLLKEQEPFFYNFRDMLTKPQWDLFKAIAKTEDLNSPSSMDFITKNRLGNPATVLRSLQSLIKKELVFTEFKKNGKPIYNVYDVLFRRWVQSM